MTFDNPITSTPGPPRKSIGGTKNNPSLRKSILRKTLHRDEDSNDDEAERRSLVATEHEAATPAASDARDSISLTPQKEHYQGCLKLYAENKITKDNAWNLQLIDFMTTMVRRHDCRMENLQTASTVVDASTRIYAYRVDAVHHDVLLMAGGLTKAVHTKRGKKGEEGGEEEAGAAEGAGPAPARRRRRARGAVAPSADQLNGDFDTNLCIDPFFERVAATAGDVTSSNRAFNATLPVHDRDLALMLRTDVRFLPAALGAARADRAGGARCRVACRLLPAAPRAPLCTPFAAFSIAHWDPLDEDGAGGAGEAGADGALDLSQQAVAFDVLADVEPVPAEPEHLADLLEEEPLGGIESEEEGDAAVAACVARAAAPPPARLADMRPAGSTRPEYSYCGLLAAWAGPAHWRLKHNRASKASERTQWGGGAGGSGEARGARARAARRALQFEGAGLAWDARAPPPDYEPALPARIMISRKTLATAPAWSELQHRTPLDRGLDAPFFRRLFTRRAPPAPPAPPAHPSQLDEARDYDYDNENDASYCPLAAQDSEWGPEEGAGRSPRAPPEDLFADMIEPPAKIAKIFIPYAMRAKKVDMKQLKQCTWRVLTEGAGEESVQPTTLFSVMGRAGGRLGAEARAGLTVPLALLAVLHLANERGLRLQPRADLADVDILGLL